MAEWQPIERCGDCRFFGNAGYDRGPCRRYPPQRDNDMTNWPSVHSSNWCGEFEPTPPSDKMGQGDE